VRTPANNSTDTRTHRGTVREPDVRPVGTAVGCPHCVAHCSADRSTDCGPQRIAHRGTVCSTDRTPDCRSDRNPDNRAHGCAVCIANCIAYSDPDVCADCNANREPERSANSGADSGSDVGSDSYAHCDSVSNTDRFTDGISELDPHRCTDCDA
jgi:hypothetical protein